MVYALQSCTKDDMPEPEPPVEEPELSYPGKEMRGVWMATVWELDWPMGEHSVEAQKKLYTDYLDRFQELNINAVFFQVKGMGDAFYDSPYEPWSKSITGMRGMDPGYEILPFLIEEANKRDIEFHAWMNPYRIATRADAGTAYPDLHQSVKPEWVISHEKIQIYKPAIPEVRQRLADIVKDMITGYDVDGIHFDDYFYPAPSSAGQMVSDAADYEKYGEDYATIENFRRGNVDKAIKLVYETIVETKPEVVFSVSPAASPDYNYETLFADVRKWCKEGWLDVVIPQLYHEIGNRYNDFQSRLTWWSQYNYEAALMIGYGFYRIGDPNAPSAFQSTGELDSQFELTRRNDKVKGHLLYSARYIPLNRIGITDKLAELYQHPSAIPFLGRSTLPKPDPPASIRIEGNSLKWNTAEDMRSVVYYFDDLEKEGIVYAITDQNELKISDAGHYSITIINEENMESEPSELLEKR